MQVGMGLDIYYSLRFMILVVFLVKITKTTTRIMEQRKYLTYESVYNCALNNYGSEGVFTNIRCSDFFLNQMYIDMF